MLTQSCALTELQAAAEEAGEQCAALAAAEVAVQGEIEALGAQKLKVREREGLAGRYGCRQGMPA